jgi:putative flippase GtrA
MKQKIKTHARALAANEKVRFGAVGMVNTATDFIVLNVLVGLVGLPLVASNIISTTTAMLVSFTLNKRAVFQGSEKGGVRQLVLFFAVTLSGIWLVQSTILSFVHHILEQAGLPAPLVLNAAKLAGICVGLVWNYFWYSRVVFKKAAR